MSKALATYVHDHLAGAQFAVSLLEDLRDQKEDQRVADVARTLLPEIEADRAELQALADRVGHAGRGVKEAAAWIAQKASRAKLTPGDPLGTYESVEMLSLGILGKLSLWNALKTLPRDVALAPLDLERLTTRAIDQHAVADHLRLSLARGALSSA